MNKPADDDEEVVELEETNGDGTKVAKKVSYWTNNYLTCPHGPYEHQVHREGDSLSWEYVGPVN